MDDALPGVFIPPFVDCRQPLDGVPGSGPNGQVCANVAISGCTEEGRYYPDYASCDVVLAQHPYAPLPPLTQPTLWTTRVWTTPTASASSRWPSSRSKPAPALAVTTPATRPKRVRCKACDRFGIACSLSDVIAT